MTPAESALLACACMSRGAFDHLVKLGTTAATFGERARAVWLAIAAAWTAGGNPKESPTVVAWLASMGVKSDGGTTQGLIEACATAQRERAIRLAADGCRMLRGPAQADAARRLADLVEGKQ